MERVEELDYVLVLFTVLQRLLHGHESLHGVLDTLKQTRGPRKSSCDWWHVARNWRVLILLVNQDSSLLEYLSNNLQVLLIELKESDLLLFKLILNDFTSEQALKALKKLEFPN